MRSHRSRDVVAEINVTPLVDIMLVLLVIFMVATPMMQQGIEVSLPKAATGQEVSDSHPTITLTKGNTIYFNNTMVTLKNLRQKLAHLKPGQPIIIRSDRSAYVNKLVEVWDICREAGFRQVHITTLPDSTVG